MRITIISVGTKPKDFVLEYINFYQKRLPKHYAVNWVFVSHGSGDPEASKQQEAEKILRAVPKGSRLFVLDERGALCHSGEFSELVFSDSTHATFVIGGAFGVDARVLEASNATLSFGKMVFPHQLVRVMLIEQIYRGYTLSIGHPYHHD